MTKWTEGCEPVGLENAAPKGSGNRNALRISMDNGTAPDSLISPVQVSSVRDESAAASSENPSITVAAVGPKAPVKVKRVVHKPPRSPVRGLLSAEKEDDEEPPGASKLDSLGHSPLQEKLKIPEWQRSALSSTFKERCKMFERKIEQTTREKKESLQKPKQSPPTLTIRNRSHSLDKLSALKIKQEDEEVQASGKRKQDRLASFRGKVKSASLEEKVEKEDFDAQETQQKAPDDEPNQKDTLAPKVPPNENINLRSKSPIKMSTTLSNKQAITGNNENVTDRCSDNLPEMAQPTRSLAPPTKPHSQYCPSPNIPAEQKPTDGVALPCQPPSKKPSSTLVESGMEVTSKEMQCERDEKKMESAARRKNKPLEGKVLPRGKRNIVESNKGSLKTAHKSTDQTDIKRSLVETPKLIICEEPAAEDESNTSKLQAHKEEGVESLQRATRHPDEQVSSDGDAPHISKSVESNDLYQPVRKKCMMDPTFRTSSAMTNKSEASATVSLETDLEAMDAENSSTQRDRLAKMEIESTEVNSPQALNQETGDQEIDVGRPQSTKCSGDIAKHHELAQKSVTTKDGRHTIKQTIGDIEVQRKSGQSSEAAEDQKFMLTPDGMEGPDAFESSKESYKRSSVKQRCKERKRRKTTVLATGSDVSGNEKEDELGGEQSDESSTSEEDDILTTPVFEQPLDDITVNTGSPATFICIISGHPAPEVHWKKDKMAVESSGPCLLGSEGGRHWLSIPVAASSDGGIYSVTASNEVGVTGCSAMLTICPGENSDYMEVSCNEKHVHPMEKEEANAVNEENPSPADDKPMTVSSLEPATVVRVQDPIITEQLATPIGESGHPPIFKDSMEDQVVLLGENALFRITIFGEPTPVVIWRRDDALVLEDERHQAGFGAEDSVAWLIVLAAEAEDDGVYGCTASNRHGTQEAHACLEVKVPSVPEKADLAFAEPLRPVTVQAGQSARLECVVITPPDAELDWLRDWRLLQPALLSCKMHFDGRRCVLDLASLHEDDSGIYACKLSTAHGKLSPGLNINIYCCFFFLILLVFILFI
uniref:Ig-like domain-containing protein n=1 Tax=Eptatretus burgeri TaxID=7764 RepID=A0A8C4QC61_EPTBU